MEDSITLPSALVQADSRLCGPPSDAPVWRAARAHAAWAVRHGVKYLPSCIRCEGLPCDVQRRVVDYYEPHNRALYASEPEFPPFELGCCDATADTTVHLLPCLTSFQGGADKKGSPKRCEMVAAGTAAG